MDDLQATEQLTRYFHFFNHLETELDNIDQFVNHRIEFRDPFSHIVGRDALRRHLARFIDNVESPTFDIRGHAVLENGYLVRWDFSGRLERFGHWQFPGVSEIRFDEHGRVAYHEDFWDSGEHFYARLPLIGTLINWIRRRV